MSQIEELQDRIAAAIDKISAGVEVLATREPEPAEPSEPDPELVAALDEEKLANAQLEERIRALKAKHAEELATVTAEATQDPAKDAELELLRSEVGKQAEALAALDQELQKLRVANDKLRDANAALRDANAEGVGEPHLINKAMLAELESLRAARGADAAEAGAILGKLEPLLAVAATHLKDVPDAENEEGV